MKLRYEDVDPYDIRFGEPTTQVIDAIGVLDYLDDVIAACDELDIIEEGLNDKYNLAVKRIVVTKSFENAVKLLYKKHRKDVLKELKDAIIKLGRYEISTGKKNHPLTNAEGHLDIHLDGGNLILLYRYDSEEVLEIGFSTSSLNQILRLQDIVTHKQLKSYDRKKYKAKTKEIDIDTIYNDEEVK